MRKYGLDNFSIKQIDSTDDFEELGRLERYYIKKYNSQSPEKGYNLTAGGESNQWDANPAAKLSHEDVVQIREIYAMCELKLEECWKLFKDKISYSAFQKVWDGTTWQGIMSEVYTKENIQSHNAQKSNPGSQNGNAKMTDEDVVQVRKYYVDHTLQETYDKYGQGYSKDGFRGTLNKTYSYLPIYHKMKKYWTLNGEIIDINNYNPVSTILESGE
nr:MAG TPA: intron associated endonuclease [Bacteriophage sp.]